MLDATQEQTSKSAGNQTGTAPLGGMTGSDLAYVGCAIVGDVFRIMARSNIKAADGHIDALLDEAGDSDD